MKKRIISLTVAGILALGTSFAGNSLKVLHLDGSEKTEALAVVGKLTVTNETLTLYSVNNEVLATSPLSSVRKITFEQGESTKVENASNDKIQIYPNPTQEAILIDGIEAGKTVRVYSLQGTLLKSEVSSDNTTKISVTDLKKGTYLLQVETEVLKFIKK